MLWIKNLLSQCNNDSITVHLFLHLLITSDNSGTVTTTLRKLAEELKTTVKKITSRLVKLESAGLIAREQQGNKKGTEREQKRTHIIVCNLESYVLSDLQQGNKKGTAREQQGNKQKETNKENISPTPPIKENNKEKYSSSSSSGACARNYIEILKGDRIWGEVVEMRYQLPPNSLSNWVNDFSLDLQCRDVVHKDIQDAKRHFCDWLRIQLKVKNNGQRNTPANKADYLQQERERITREVAQINEEYLRRQPR